MGILSHMSTNYQMVATEMRNSLVELPGYSATEITADDTGWWFILTIPARADHKGRRTPGGVQKRHIGLDGTLTVTKL
jgi:hypothetical protein